MTNINLSYPHEKSIAEVKGYIDEYAGKLKQKYDVESNWQNDTQLDLKRNGLSGNVNFDAHNVNIDLKLGFMLRMFKSAIEDGIKEHLVEKLS